MESFWRRNGLDLTLVTLLPVLAPETVEHHLGQGPSPGILVDLVGVEGDPFLGPVVVEVLSSFVDADASFEGVKPADLLEPLTEHLTSAFEQEHVRFAVGDEFLVKIEDVLGKLLARRPSSRPKDGHFSEMGGFRRPVLGGNLRTSVRNVTKQCV